MFEHVEPFGAGLHVRGPEDQLRADQLRAALGAVEVEEIAPTLEDVFLEVVRKGAAA